MIPQHVRLAVRSRTVLFVDPGVRVVGFCVHDSALDALGVVVAGISEVDNDDPRLTAMQHLDNIRKACPYGFLPAVRVVEFMTMRGRKTPNPQDLLNVQLVAGVLGTHWVTPAEWKGSISRELEERRTKSKLEEWELDLPVYGCKNLKIRDVKPTSKKAHNALSAVGIAVACLERKALR